MKIWIYLNGLQQGPYSIEQVKLLPIDAGTPVWYDGLSQWTPAGQTPLLAPLFTTAAPETGDPAGNSAADAARAAMAAAQAAQAAAQAAQTAQKATTPPRPSTYIVWSIIFTILCCSPFALAGIVTGAISSSRYNAGDYAGAKSMSTVTEWLLIISIVWAIVGIPVGLVKGCCAAALL